MTEDQIKSIIIEMVQAQIPESVNSELTLTDDLNDLGFDSIQVVNLIVTIEEQFNFEFSTTDLNLKNFQSINNIVNLLCKKMGIIYYS